MEEAEKERAQARECKLGRISMCNRDGSVANHVGRTGERAVN